jgi:broad specificity phosphatase PhoE
MREGGFSTPDEPLDAGGRDKAAKLADAVKSYRQIHSSPYLAAVETVAALGLAPQIFEALRDVDVGRFGGLTFASLSLSAPEALADWMADPTQAPPEGEALSAVSERAAAWLSALLEEPQSSPVLAITHPMVIRAALSAALGAPLAMTLKIDIAPLAAVTLSHNGGWRLQGVGRLQASDVLA